MQKPINEIERLKLIAGLINEVNYNDSIYGINRTTLLTENKKKEAKKKEVTIDTVNPYEYRHGIQFELTELDDYSDEALEKAKATVLKNLAKDANFYSTLLNAKPSPFTFKQTETDAPGMQANADGTLKKGAGKLDKANVKDNLGKKEEGSKKPKGVKVMPDKGVEGKEKVVKEGLEEAKKSKYITVDARGNYQLNSKAIEAYLKSAIDPTEIENVDVFMNANKGYGESSTYFFDNYTDHFWKYDDPAKTPDNVIEDWVKQEMSYFFFDTPNEFPSKEMSEGKEEMNEAFKYFDNYEDFEETLFQLYPQVKANPEKYKKDGIDGEVRYSDGYVNWASWYPNRPNTPSGLPPGAVNMNNKMSQSDLIYPAGSRMDEHHNDPNFPGGTKIHAMLDKVADEWGRDSDVYSDLEDAITGWSDRNGELTPKGKIAIRALLSNWDMLDDYEEFLGEDIESDPVNGDSSAEGQFNQLVSRYDWYHEMSDDPRKWDAGTAIDQKLKSLAKTIGVDKAVELFNAKAPSDRKVTSTFFAEGKDKHSKIKEALKAALQKEGDIEDATAKKSAIQTEKAKLIALNKQKTELLADTSKTKEVKDAELKGITLKMRAAQDSLNKLNQGKIDVV
jgi:hypothetical protein